MINYIEEIEEIYPNYFDSQRECNHGYKGNPNPFHLEAYGNVFGHTKAVYKEALTKFPDDCILQLACLLHDIGKPICRFENIETERCSFFNHENIGPFLAIDILKKLNLSKDDILRVLRLIQRHADSYKLSAKNLRALYNKEQFDDICKIRICDTLGRICKGGNEADLEQLENVKTLSFNNSKKFPNPTLTCTLLIGPPASGKSEFINSSIYKTAVIEVANEFNRKNKNN